MLACALVGGLAARAVAATDAREIKAREDCVAGRYEVALETFARLYAETLHPNYLRNIGRCYQNLGEPDRAITSFRDYLRKGKNISRQERAEVEGFIKEMEDLKRERAAAAPAVSAPVPAAKPETAAQVGAPVAPLPSPVNVSSPVSISLVAPPPAPEREASPPIYGRWWFWAIVVGAVGAGVGVAAAAGAFSHTTEPNCGGFKCGM